MLCQFFYGYGYGYDPKYLLFVMLPLLVLSGLTSFFLKITYSKYSQIGSQRGLSGAEAARRILETAGVTEVRVESVDGFLSDHYDPREKVVRLSPQNFEGRSIAAIGVAAHECGHAIQHATAYAPLAIRNLAVPVANIGSSLGYIVIIIGLAMHFQGLAMLGLVLIGCIFLYQLVNLPVEFDASARALRILPETGILTPEENRGARSVLAAAALTYVAAMIGAALQLLYWAMRLGLIGGRSRDDR